MAMSAVLPISRLPNYSITQLCSLPSPSIPRSKRLSSSHPTRCSCGTAALGCGFLLPPCSSAASVVKVLVSPFNFGDFGTSGNFGNLFWLTAGFDPRLFALIRGRGFCRSVSSALISGKVVLFPTVLPMTRFQIWGTYPPFIPRSKGLTRSTPIDTCVAQPPPAVGVRLARGLVANTVSPYLSFPRRPTNL